MAESQYGFPTEVLSLPSQGLLYPEDSPLRSGNIDVKYMTAKEEDILTSANLINQGVVIDRLLESIIADSKVKLDDMLIGDKNALMVGARVLGYGKSYPIMITDPDTNAQVEYEVDLSNLKNKDVDTSVFTGENKFEFELPYSKRVIGFKLLTHKDEREIKETQKGLEKVEKLTGVSSILTTRFKQQIISIDGSEDKKEINEFVDNSFLAMDSREFRMYADSITPDIEMKFDYTSQTGNVHTMDIPLRVEFFWPAGD